MLKPASFIYFLLVEELDFPFFDKIRTEIDRQTEHGQPTDRLDHREVSLPINKLLCASTEFLLQMVYPAIEF